MKHPHYAIPLLVLSAATQNANALATPENDYATMTQEQGFVDIPVLQNDSSDLEGGGQLYIGEYSQPSNGSVSVGYGGFITYVPNEGYTGEDVFTYQALDESGYGGFASVFVNVVSQGPEPGTGFEPYAVGATNKAIARMLDQNCTFNAGEGGGVLSIQQIPQAGEICALLAETADLNAALREIAPEEALIQRDLLSNHSRNKTSRLYNAIASMRAGRNASLSVNGTTLPFGGGAAGDGLGSPWTFLSSLQIENFEHDQTGNEAGYDSDAKGLMVGLGYRLNSNLNIGGAVDWMTYDVGYDGDSGDLDSDIYSLTGFLSWYRNALALDLQLGYTNGDTKAQRRFSQIELPSFADSDYSSNQLDASAQLDWSWQQQAWTLRPFLRLDYFKTEIDAFAETGNSMWLVSAEKQNHEQLNTSLGVDTSYTLTYSWGVMVPAVKLSLVNQANLSNSPVAFQLVNDASELGRFELRADSPDSLFYQWDLSSAFILAGGLSTFVGAQILSGYDGVSAYQVNAGVNWEF
ncbi:MAG: autotransporter domain-containing protein [Cellvibrionaceae bacterium]|nr:autotransporter domain-containing protein [Cellvibrionaceae bacterium]